MKKHWVIFKNGIKFFIMADSFAVSGDSLRWEFTRSSTATPDMVLKSEVAAILVDGTADDTGNGQPLVG